MKYEGVPVSNLMYLVCRYSAFFGEYLMSQPITGISSKTFSVGVSKYLCQ